MCYYDLYIFLSCGHAARAHEPIKGCPLREKEASDRQYMRTPSLTHSVSTRASRQTTDGSAEPSPESHTNEATAEQPDTENTRPDTPEEPCTAVLTHPFHTHRSHGSCPSCWQTAQSRLSDLDVTIAQSQTAFTEKHRREKVSLNLQSKTPRPLMLVMRREAEQIAEKADQEEAVAAQKPPPPSPHTTINDAASVYFNDAASTVSQIKSLWTRSRKKPESILSAEAMSPIDTAEQMSPVESNILAKDTEDF